MGKKQVLLKFQASPGVSLSPTPSSRNEIEGIGQISVHLAAFLPQTASQLLSVMPLDRGPEYRLALPVVNTKFTFDNLKKIFAQISWTNIGEGAKSILEDGQNNTANAQTLGAAADNSTQHDDNFQLEGALPTEGEPSLQPAAKISSSQEIKQVLPQEVDNVLPQVEDKSSHEEGVVLAESAGTSAPLSPPPSRGGPTAPRALLEASPIPSASTPPRPSTPVQHDPSLGPPKPPPLPEEQLWVPKPRGADVPTPPPPELEKTSSSGLRGPTPLVEDLNAELRNAVLKPNLKPVVSTSHIVAKTVELPGSFLDELKDKIAARNKKNENLL